MKKTIMSALLCLSATLAGAQTMSDALNLSQTNYYGTARTMALGNAVTAVGGDLGTIGINPAGSAVAGYSQFTITPGLTIASTGASFAPSYNVTSGSQNYGEVNNVNKGRMTMPNVGLTCRFETGNAYGLKSMTFGVVSSMTNNFNMKATAVGTESTSSITGCFATMASSNADGYGHMLDPNILSSSNMFNNSSFRWNYLSAYDGGLINYNADAGTYYGSGELKYYNPGTGEYTYFVPGTLRNTISNVTSGSKNDMLFNLGLNFNDNFYLGFNVGIPSISYKSTEFFRETAVNPEDFPVTPEYNMNGAHVIESPTYYKGSTYQYSYAADVKGIYAKVGLIWLPTSSLRIGAAFQTPTGLLVNEIWEISQASYFENSNCDGSSYSPTGEYSYDLRTPYSMNAGLAYTIGKLGMLSVDYELTDFSVMKYSSSSSDFGDDGFYAVNRLNKLFCGVSHMLRAGAEVRINPALSLRAGYTVKTDPGKYYTDSDGDTVDAAYYDANFNYYENGSASLVDSHYFKAPVKSWSVGAGYASGRSFFADFALRQTIYPTTYYSPYANYLEDYDSPSAKMSRKLWEAVLTFGWRF